MNPRLQHNTQAQRQSFCQSCSGLWSHFCPLHTPVFGQINHFNGKTMETKCSFRRKWFLAAVSVAVCLTRVWLSITWCSRMMKRAEALIGEPKDSSPTSDPANAWDKHHNHCVRSFYYHVILSVISCMAVSWRDIKKKNIYTIVGWETVHSSSRAIYILKNKNSSEGSLWLTEWFDSVLTK